jgi:hypothetical protein
MSGRYHPYANRNVRYDERIETIEARVSDEEARRAREEERKKRENEAKQSSRIFGNPHPQQQQVWCFMFCETALGPPPPLYTYLNKLPSNMLEENSLL